MKNIHELSSEVEHRNGSHSNGLTKGEGLLFLKAFLKNPSYVGALAPSSRYLADAMTDYPWLFEAKTVVELGCGTGAITECILEKIPSTATYLGIELDGDCVKHLRKRFPNRTFCHGSAEEIKKYLADMGVGSPDVVISGLPWAVLPQELQDGIISEVVDCLAPGGKFLTFAYLHAKIMPRAVRLKKHLRHCFGGVEISKTVWKNFPPAFYYICNKPKARNGC
ncbi:MAG: methyltransferase domain-containing protein [Synergistales bacterium]|nr:methyltransferase domain-containing protein [Synergistales bacterium]